MQVNKKKNVPYFFLLLINDGITRNKKDYAKLKTSFYRLCRIEPGEVVCDPMCGGGTIPIEVRKFYCFIKENK